MLLYHRRKLTQLLSDIVRTYAVVHNKLSELEIQRMRKMALPQSRPDPVIMRLDNPDFQSIFTPELHSLSALFSKYNYELRIAGGAVRDLLSGLKPTDLDFATTATPTQMKHMFETEGVRMINTNGEKHGTITPRINDKENFEVTTLRIDVVTDGRHAQVQFTTDWMLDAMRRDLTINSMFLDLKGSVYDYFYGYDDLQACKVRFVGDPDTRIKEDYLRILRYFRFYGRIAKEPNDHEPDTLKAITENKAGLGDISGERIWAELKKILAGNFAGDLLAQIIECGLSPYVGLPTKPNTEELQRVWKQRNRDMHPITLLCSVLNTEEDAVDLNARLKLSVFERELMFFVVAHRAPKLHVNPIKAYKDLVVKSKKPSDTYKYTVEVLKYNGSSVLAEFEKWTIPRFPITGAILKAKGVESGKVMGLVMYKLKDFWVDLDFTDDVEEVLKHLPAVLESLTLRKKNQ